MRFLSFRTDLARLRDVVMNSLKTFKMLNRFFSRSWQKIYKELRVADATLLALIPLQWTEEDCSCVICLNEGCCQANIYLRNRCHKGTPLSRNLAAVETTKWGCRFYPNKRIPLAGYPVSMHTLPCSFLSSDAEIKWIHTSSRNRLFVILNSPTNEAEHVEASFVDEVLFI